MPTPNHMRGNLASPSDVQPGMRMPTRILVAAAVALLATGCGRLLGGGGAPPELRGDWMLAEGQVDGALLDVPDGHRITLTVDEQELGGTSACNHYGARFEAAAGRFELVDDGLWMTEMACEPAVMEVEQRYLDAFGRGEVIQRADEQLLIMGGGVELRFDPVAPVDDAAVAGTRWVLETLLQGEVASSVSGDGSLQLHEDGTLDGSTGCQHLRGRWETNGDEIVFPEFGAEGECPQELQPQDDHVVTVLGDGFRPEVEGEQLTLTDGELGLVYRAAD